jgi:hypothetical protein
VHLLNRMPSKALNFQTPLQVLSSHISLPTKLLIPSRVFNCVVFVHLHKNQRSKLDPYVVRCIFLWYALHKKGYRCYDPTTKRTYVTMDATFLESDPFFPPPISNSPLQEEIRKEELKWTSLNFKWPVLEENSTQVDNGNEMTIDESMSSASD